MKVLGALEIKIPRVGLVEFLVVDECVHDCIVGWDALYKHKFSLSEDEMLWGEAIYPYTPYVRPKAQISSVDPSKALGRYKTAFDTLLRRFQKIFGVAGTLEAANVDPMNIVTEGSPVHQRAYQIPHRKKHLADEEIDKMLQMGIIRPSSSPWASPILLVPKKDGSVRFCVDYRKVNSVTVKDRYPLPRIQDIFDQMGDATVFSTMDMRSGYWQVPLAPEDIPKTAFVCHRGMFEFVRVPFGLGNAPSHYQRIMTKALGKFIGKFVHVFLDDVVVYSKTQEEHLEHLKQVFEAIAEAGLTVKESKCSFFQTEVELLGFIVGKDGLRAQPQKTEAILRQPPPRDVPELRRFLGMASYYRQLVPHFAKTAEPLHHLIRQGVDWEWGPAQKEAFESLKKDLASDQVMAHPDLNSPYILYTDACDYAIGGILCQEDENGIERPIQYVSAQLNQTQRRWATVEKEAYAVIYCLKKLRTYLLGADLTVYTDHKPLMCLFTSEVANTKIQRWAVLLSEFNARIKYRPGENNVRADMLSRLKDSPETDEEVFCLDYDLAVIDMETTWVVPEDDPDLGQLILPDPLDYDDVAAAQHAEFPEEWEAAVAKEEGYFLREGMVFSSRRTNRYEPLYPRLLLPEQFRQQILERCHQEAGHAGAVKTMLKVQDHYVWPRMRTDTDEFYKACPLCHVHVARPDRPPMGEMPVAQSPGQIWSMDLIGPLPQSERGYRYALVMLDHYSGWPEVYPLRNKTNEEVWRCIRVDFIPRHGSPRVLISDQGTEFKSRGFDEWLIGNQIDHRRTTPYHPQTNGKVERLNRTFKEMLRKLVNTQTHRWEDEIGTALWAIRTNVSTVTGYSPFLLQYARPGRAPVRSMLEGDDWFDFNNRLHRQSQLFRGAKLATIESRRYNRRRLEDRQTGGAIRPGDHVIKKAHETLPLTAQWDHVFLVTASNGLVLDLVHPETGKTHRVHRAHVKLVDPDLPWDDVLPRPRRKRRAAPPDLPPPPALAGPAAPQHQHLPLVLEIPEGIPPDPSPAPSTDASDADDQHRASRSDHTGRELSPCPPPLTARDRRALNRALRKRREETIERELGHSSDDSPAASPPPRRRRSPAPASTDQPMETSHSDSRGARDRPSVVLDKTRSQEVTSQGKPSSGIFSKVKSGFKKWFKREKGPSSVKLDPIKPSGAISELFESATETDQPRSLKTGGGDGAEFGTHPFKTFSETAETDDVAMETAVERSDGEAGAAKDASAPQLSANSRPADRGHQPPDYPSADKPAPDLYKQGQPAVTSLPAAADATTEPRDIPDPRTGGAETAQIRRSARKRRPPVWRRDYYTQQQYDLALPPGVPDSEVSSGSSTGREPRPKRRHLDPWNP